MKLRLDEYYYILNVDNGWEEIKEYMPEDMADKYLKFCESHSSKEIDEYLENLYSYIEEVDIHYDIDDIELDKSYIKYKAIIEIEGKYYSFYWYDTWHWNFEDKVDSDQNLIEVVLKEVTIIKYENK
nr:MAG TPA: hypothetical protein [Crassvirales sp.]